MKTRFLSLATGVLGIVAGFMAARGGGDGEGIAGKDGPEKTRVGEENSQHVSRTADGQLDGSPDEAVLSNFLKGRSPAEVTPGEVLALLMPQIRADWVSETLESSRMDYQLQLLAFHLPPEVIEGVVELGRKENVPQYRVNRLFGEYATRNLERALAWAETRPDAMLLRNVVILRLAERDPARAEAIYQTNLLAGGLERRSFDEITLVLGAGYARLGQEEFFRFMDEMSPGREIGLINYSVERLPKEDIPAFLAEIRQRTEDGRMDSQRLDSLFLNAAGKHPLETRKWLASFEPGERRAQMELKLAASLSRKGNSGDTDELLRSAMAGFAGKEKEFVIKQAGALIGSNPLVAGKLVNLLPEGQELTLEDVKSWNKTLSFSRPDVVLDVAIQLRSPEEQAAYLEDSFNRLGNSESRNTKINARDFQLLENRLQTSDLSADAMSRGKIALQLARERVLGK